MRSKYVNIIATILPIIKNIRWNFLVINLPWWSPKQIMENMSIRLLEEGNFTKVSKEHDWGNTQKKAKKWCMPFCYYPISFVSEMVSSSRSITIGEEVADIATLKVQEEEGELEGKVYKK